MDLQTTRAHNGPKWSWARNGALILFLVTGILLVASLTTAHSQQADARLPLLAGDISHTNSLL